MSGVFQYIDPPPPDRPSSVYPLLWGREGGEGGGGSIFWKTPDTALYSTYVSTLCCNAMGTKRLTPPLLQEEEKKMKVYSTKKKAPNYQHLVVCCIC
jgi:hypothetical protein